MRELIAATYDLFRQDLNENDILEQLVAGGCPLDTAEKLIVFVPLACGRALLANTGVVLSDSYMGMDLSGREGPLQKLASDPQWLAVEDFVAVQQLSSPVTVAVIGRRSAEFDAANQALHKGSEPANLVCSPPIFLRPCFA